MRNTDYKTGRDDIEHWNGSSLQSKMEVTHLKTLQANTPILFAYLFEWQGTKEENAEYSSHVMENQPYTGEGRTTVLRSDCRLCDVWRCRLWLRKWEVRGGGAS